ncbi:MAG: hypothetical protein KAH06_02110 [Desulfobacterales bacterium]|nr:hypothetical protein [Desulfobacterales bacterium]
MDPLQKKDKKPAKTVKNKKRTSNKRKLSIFDRRTEELRRKIYSIDYFSMNGAERRKRKKDRRKLDEQRSGWVRINKWISMFVGKNK